MKALNQLFKDATWSNGNWPKPIVFDNLTEEDIPFLEKNGFDFLVIEVCDVCLKKKCKCKKSQQNDKTELK